jgi:hypothetical protein
VVVLVATAIASFSDAIEVGVQQDAAPIDSR